MERIWQPLGEVAPDQLVDARLQLHHATQIAAAVGTSLAAPLADYSHTSLEWLAGPAVLAGGLIEGTPPFRAALRPADLMLLLLDADERIIADDMLNGKTLASGLDWMRRQVGAFGADGAKVEPPSYQPGEFPSHPVGEGRTFELDPLAFAELAHYYADADLLLRDLAVREPRASAVRCWPHHFDIATLIKLDDTEGEQARTIGVGLSPGDAGYTEPYFYVTPWPYPEVSKLPPLPLGGWHTEGWVGAVLTASALLAGDNEGQEQRASGFMAQAVAACQTLMGDTHHG
ncbi:MAG: hypothetical protein DLM69_04470 [Candidatus Chloroheliales bacterium]|nr:MAG: hypothetical protein DLM69_04470 [Chloroflexota bacterium]